MLCQGSAQLVTSQVLESHVGEHWEGAASDAGGGRGGGNQKGGGRFCDSSCWKPLQL